VPVSNTIGEVGRGFQQQMRQFQDERLVCCFNWLSPAFHLWERTRKYAEEREMFGAPLSKMQVTQFKLVGMLTQLHAARAITYDALRKHISGEDATVEISMAKLFCGRTVRFVSDECMQLHGGLGYTKECVAGRAFVDARLCSIGGGADETLIQYTAQRLGF